MQARHAPAAPARQSRSVAAPAPSIKHARNLLLAGRPASLLPSSPRAPLSLPSAPARALPRRRRRALAPGPPAAAAAAAAAAAPFPSGDGDRPAASPLASLQQAVPVDRLRYQALLVFNHFDTDGDGALNAAEYGAYARYAANKAPWAPAVGAALSAAAAPYLPAAQGSPGLGREAFVSLVRAQLAAVAASPGGPLDAPGAAGLVPQEAARLCAQGALSRAELLAARWAFLLIDLDNDNRGRYDDVRRAGGVELGVAEARGLFDAEDEEDEEGASGAAAAAGGGAAAGASPAAAAAAAAFAAAQRGAPGTFSFEQYLTATYARPREPFKAAAVLIANTVLVWAIVQFPCDLFLKGAAIAALLIRPQIVARPVVWVHDLIFGLINGARARAELARRQRGG